MKTHTMNFMGKEIDVLMSRENGRVLITREERLVLSPLFEGMGKPWNEGDRLPDTLPYEIRPCRMTVPDITDKHPATVEAHYALMKKYWENATFETHQNEEYRDIGSESEFQDRRAGKLKETLEEHKSDPLTIDEVWRKHPTAAEAESWGFPMDADLDLIACNLIRNAENEPDRLMSQVSCSAIYEDGTILYLRAVNTQPLTAEDLELLKAIQPAPQKGRRRKYSKQELRIASEWAQWHADKPNGTMRQFIDNHRHNITPEKLKRVHDSWRKGRKI